MKKRIIIGKNKNDYYYLISVRINGDWLVIDSKSYNAEERIKNLLNIKIDNLKYIDNLLFVKTNDDLVVIENYSQLNHDKVFKSFNKQASTFTINKNLLNKNITLQKKSNHKRAIINPKALCAAAIVGILILSPSLIIESDNNNNMVPSSKAIVEQQPILNIGINDNDNILDIARKASPKPTISPDEEYFQKKIEEYSTMYSIDYDHALELFKENEEKIKTEYVNQEVGIIRVLAEELLNDSKINKKPEVSKITPLEREKLLLQFAKIHEIKDSDTLATMLAIYRLETGNGTSPACIHKNNFGGLRARNSETGEYYVLSFKTPQIGAEAMVSNFLRMKQIARNNKHYSPSRSLELNMNYIYCGERSWPIKVQELKEEVIIDYNLNEYVSKESPKQLVK